MTSRPDHDADPTEDADPMASGSSTDEDVDPGWPWSFLLLVAAGAIYLIVRFVEMGIDLFG